MADHILVVEGTEEDGYELSIECLVPGGQHGWHECCEDHTAELAAATAAEHACLAALHAPACDCAGDWRDGDEMILHGALHEYRDGYDWTVDFPGCALTAALADFAPDAEDIAIEHGAGRWLIEDDWSEAEGPMLIFIGPANPVVIVTPEQMDALYLALDDFRIDVEHCMPSPFLAPNYDDAITAVLDALDLVRPTGCSR